MKDRLHLMTHVVVGYPDFETTEKLLAVMVKEGVSYIELQLPFSDPIGDGSAIMKANQSVLDAGVTIEDCLRFIERQRKLIPVPIFIMTYANIPFRYGIERFIQRGRDMNISGFIIPDMPFDEKEFDSFTRKDGPPLVPVVSANSQDIRLKQIAKKSRFMVYCTLRVGITGVTRSLDTEIVSFLKRLRSYFAVPIIGGFGISSVQQLALLRGAVDVAVIGSHVLHVLDAEGVSGVQRFLKNALRQCRK